MRTQLRGQFAESVQLMDVPDVVGRLRSPLMEFHPKAVSVAPDEGPCDWLEVLGGAVARTFE
jgi:hypothetical protein